MQPRRQPERVKPADQPLRPTASAVKRLRQPRQQGPEADAGDAAAMEASPNAEPALAGLDPILKNSVGSPGSI